MPLSSTLERFPWREGEHYVVAESGCWEWVRATYRGYGISSQGHAHRVGYEALHGELDPKIHVHHRCHNPACVNPDHLEPVPIVEHCRAHKRGTLSDLTAEKVVELREAAAAGVHFAALAQRYGIHVNTARNIVMGRTWPEVGGPIGLEAQPIRTCAWSKCDRPVPPGHRNKRTCCRNHRQYAWLERAKRAA